MKGETMAVDLGTTFSLVSIVGGTGQPEEVPNSDGDRTTPSVVKFGENGGTEVGKTARRSAISEPDRVVKEVKRKMGTDWRFELDGDKHSPQEISSLILQKLKEDTEKRVGKAVNKAIISVPAYFRESERKATKEAGKLTGFDRITLVEEPVAGFLSEVLQGGQLEGYFLIYDLGGGTFDVSILKSEGSDIDVVAIEGVSELGGGDFTGRIVGWLEEEFGEFEDPKVRQDVLNRAEEAKKELSSTTKTIIPLALGSGFERKELTRTKFEKLIDDLLDRTLEESEEALNSAGLDGTDLEEVILIGGSSRIPKVKEKVEGSLGIEPKVSSKPETAVAIGAMIKAAEENDIPLYDQRGEALPPFFVNQMLAHSVGVESVDRDSGEELNSIIIEKGEELPAQGKETFTTEVDNQTNIRVRILEGESKKSKNCQTIGDDEGYMIDGIPRMPAGVPTIEITAEMNTEGILRVKAVELDSGRTLETQVERDGLIE